MDKNREFVRVCTVKNYSFNIAMAMLDFFLLLPILPILQVVNFHLFAPLFELVLYIDSSSLFCIAPSISIDSWSSFSLLESIAKNNRKLFAIVYNSEKEQQLSLAGGINIKRANKKRSKELI